MLKNKKKLFCLDNHLKPHHTIPTYIYFIIFQFGNKQMLKIWLNNPNSTKITSVQSDLPVEGGKKFFKKLLNWDEI